MKMYYNTLEDEKRAMQDEAEIIFELKCKTRGKKYKELAEIVQKNIDFLRKSKKEIKKYLKGYEVSICSDGIIAWQIYKERGL